MATTRGRVVFVALTLFIIYFLFIASPASQSEREYRQRTQDGLARRRSKMQGDISDQEWTRQTNEKLRAILETHPHGNRANRNPGDREPYVPVEKPGDTPKYPKPKNADGDEDTTGRGNGGVAGSGSRSRQQQKGIKSSSNKSGEEGQSGKDQAREQLQTYLKNPVVIFSKSYCPHSKRAKQLLTEIYTITPAPLIVELDLLTEKIHVPSSSDTSDSSDSDPSEHQHLTTLGQELQLLLGEITHRSTVPNIMVGMQSIGGNDLIWDMHERGELVGMITKLAGKRVSMEVNGDHADGKER